MATFKDGSWPTLPDGSPEQRRAFDKWLDEEAAPMMAALSGKKVEITAEMKDAFWQERKGMINWLIVGMAKAQQDPRFKRP
jgi:hypothetical protein